MTPGDPPTIQGPKNQEHVTGTAGQRVTQAVTGVTVSVASAVYPELRPHPAKRVARQFTGCAHAPGIDVPTISVFYGIVIRMFFRDHSPPHFHAEYAGHSAAIAIDSLEVLAGSLPGRTLAMVLEWASLHRAELRADWEQCRRHERPTRIAPLE